MSEIDFDKVSFEEVDIDDIDSVSLEDLPDFNPDYMSLNDNEEIPVSVGLKAKSSHEVAEEVEAVLLSLLESNDRRTILILTGERPDLKQDIDPKVYRDFIALYGQAVLYNPGVKWYGKFVNTIREESFKVEGGKLELSLTAREFQKLLHPFLTEFKPELMDSSPIVELVLNFAEKNGQVELKKKQASQKQEGKFGQDEDVQTLEIGDSDVGDESLFDTDVVSDAGDEMHVDDNDSLSQTRVTDHISSKISLTDLANKAIAQYLVENGILKDDKVLERLREEGLTKQRTHEILGIVKYMRLTDPNARKLVKSTLQGDFGGDVNFDFEV